MAEVINTYTADEDSNETNDSSSSSDSNSSSSSDIVSEENTAHVTLTDVVGEDGFRKTQDQLEEDLVKKIR